MQCASDLSNFIYSFHMPLFFVISGLCIKDSKSLSVVTFNKMVRAYLVPYVVWTVIYTAIREAKVMVGEESVIDLNNWFFAHAISICGVAPLWFLLALFIAESITLMLKPLLQNLFVSVATLILFASASIVSSFYYDSLSDINLVVRNYLMGFFRIFPTTFFVLFGYVFKQKILKSCEWNSRIRGIVFCIQLCLCINWNESIDVHVFTLANQWLYFIKSINGCMIILLMSQTIHFTVLMTLGRKTKEIMILHYPPFVWIPVMKFVMGMMFFPNIYCAVIITVATIGGCLFVDLICRRFRIWQFIMGNKMIKTNLGCQ